MKTLSCLDCGESFTIQGDAGDLVPIHCAKCRFLTPEFRKIKELEKRIKIIEEKLK